MRIWPLALLALFAACSPQDLADKVAQRAAESVVLPVVARYLPGPQAQAASSCVIESASAGELRMLARDVGVEAGSSTFATVLDIAARPQTLACLSRAGLGPIGG